MEKHLKPHAIDRHTFHSRHTRKLTSNTNIQQYILMKKLSVQQTKPHEIYTHGRFKTFKVKHENALCGPYDLDNLLNVLVL